ncbi:MAG: insulinase family protein [Desulfarculus sp.]|nr:MAG: insulinase family protein [Desulfarculus sp.]
MRKLAAPLLMLLVIILLPGLALAAPQRLKLDNGLTVILAENHEAPVAAFQVWVRAGSIYEGPRERGITHLIEHMIFKGTPRRPAGQMAGEIEALGGEVNAYTTLDHTNYFVVAASAQAAQALDILADAVVNASFDAGELAKEKEVVVEEIRMNLDKPSRRLHWEVFRQAFGDTPYGRPVIGNIASVRAITRADILAYKARWYRAPNMMVVAVGDFKAAQVLPLIKKAFAGLSAQPAPGFQLPAEARPPGPRLAVMREKVKQAAISVTWRTPGLPDPVVYPLDVAASVAGDGETSRLYSQLKEKRGLVDSVSAGAYTPQTVGLFEVEASLAPDKVAAAWPELLAQTLSLVSRPPQPAELRRARVNLAAGFVRGRQTMQGQARTLGYFEMFRGGFENIATYMQRFDAVGAAQVSQTAQRWLRPENLSVVIQLPEGAAAPDLAQLQAQAAKLFAAAAPPALNDQKPSRQVLANGLVLIIKPAHAVPLVSYLLAAPGGQVAETAAEAGLHSLWAKAVTRGTEKRSYEELTRELEDMAGSLGGYSGRTTAGLSGSFLSQDWRRGLELLAEVWLRPSFPAAQVARAQAEQAAALRAQQNSPTSRAFKKFRALLYPDHPFGRDPLGTPQTLAKLGRGELLAASKRMRGPGGVVLTVVGDVDPAAVLDQVQRLFGALKGRAAAVEVPPVSPPERPRTDKVAEPGAKQTQIMLGYIAPGLGQPGSYALRLADTILGGMGGRLFADLRDKRSLAYAVQPFYSPSQGVGVFGVYMGVGPGKEPAALAGLAEHLERLRRQPPGAAELQRARAYYLGGAAIGLQTYAAQARALSDGETMGLGYLYYTTVPAKIRAVTAEQVQQAAARYLDPQRQIELTQGP